MLLGLGSLPKAPWEGIDGSLGKKKGNPQNKFVHKAEPQRRPGAWNCFPFLSNSLRVLVVDDEEPVRLLLARILKPEGYLVELASNASQARQIMSKQPFDVVLCDLTMPVSRAWS
jgi:PleD family two-component response regulator